MQAILKCSAQPTSKNKQIRESQNFLHIKKPRLRGASNYALNYFSSVSSSSVLKESSSS